MDQHPRSSYVIESTIKITAHCDRCGKSCDSFVMSMFNTSMICDSCLNKEQYHLKYPKACQTELRALKSGDRNHPGIGLPKDLGAI